MKVSSPFKCISGGGFTYIAIPSPQEGMVARILQIFENELCLEHQNHKKTQNNLDTAVL